MAMAERIARAGVRMERISYGYVDGEPSSRPWRGTMRSVSAEQVPRDYAAGATNMNYLPRFPAGFVTRKGQSIKFETSVAAAVGLLPNDWNENGLHVGARCRQLEEFPGALTDDGIPSLVSLCTSETVETGLLDDGRFSNLWVRDQANDLNYTLGAEFSSTTYPVPGTEATLKYVPLWYDSGYGGITRGITEYQRRFFVGGSRRVQKVGNWYYSPSLYGTPSRWNGVINPFTTIVHTARPSASAQGGVGLNWVRSPGAGVLTAAWEDVDDTDADLDGTDYVRYTGNGSTDPTMSFTCASATLVDPGTDSGFTVKITMRSSAAPSAPNSYLTINMTATGGGDAIFNKTVGYSGNTGYTADLGNLTTDFVQYTVSLSDAEGAAVRTHNVGLNLDSFVIQFDHNGIPPSGTFDVAQIEFNAPGVDTAPANRLIPSGPLPPIHAGTLAKGDLIEANANFIRPDADVDDGSWTGQDAGTSLFSYIDETSRSDADYIQSSNAGAGSYVAKIALGNFGFEPSADDEVNVQLYYKHDSTTTSLTVALVQGAATTISSRLVSPVWTSTGFGYFAWLLTPTEIASVTDWDDLRLWFTATAISTARVYVSYATVGHVSAESTSTEGGWRGADKFYYSVAYRFEDGSIWAPCTPRGPNDLLTSGFNLFQVDADNVTAGYEKVTWSNIPIGPYGCTGRVLLRSTKINTTTDSILQLNPKDLRVVEIIQDNTTTTYDDFKADDDALDLASILNGVVRLDDHLMPPRARYIFAGDSRVCHSYGGENPCAIQFAPVGFSADYDRNLDDEDSTLWGANAFYYRLSPSSLELVKDTGGGTPTITTLSLTTYNTLEKLVDVINASTYSDSGGQWRAQLCPGANGQAAPATTLTPTQSSDYSNCVVSNVTNTTQLTRAAGGLSAIAVGRFITKADVTAGTYVLEIVSDTELTMSAAATGASTGTASFRTGTGDDTSDAAITQYSGYVRALSGSLPSFLYFRKTYLDTFPLEKNSVWMTVASPGQSKSAANSFSNAPGNRHVPPEADAGISMGGIPVDNGFVTPMANKLYVIRNIQGTGSDFDYKMYLTNPAEGCVAWQSLCAGPRCAILFAPSGWKGVDVGDQNRGPAEVKLSDAVYQDRPNNLTSGVTSIGDFGYEAAASIAATAQDNDGSRMVGRVMRGALYVNYRDASSSTHQDRQGRLDFDGVNAAGIAALRRPDGSEWGWDGEHSRSMSAMVEASRDDGPHLYGWNDANAGSTGDGRVDEFDTGTTDNSTAITSTLPVPWLQLGDDQISVQEVLAEHLSPSGATVALRLYRGAVAAPDTHDLSPTLSSTLTFIRDLKLFNTEDRTPAGAVYLEWRQTAGSPSEVRGLVLKYKRLPQLRPAA